MKKVLLFAAAAWMLAACAPKEPQLAIVVSNPLGIERTLETIEIPWDTLASTLLAEGLSPFAVFDAQGNEIPSQAVYNGEEMPQLLIFQATVAANGTSEYFVRRVETQPEYPAQAFGRYVPERMDDYAWENNLVGFRVYGPALPDPKTPGVDVWNKRPDASLVIDEWYKIGDYHHDIGKGMDAYKVANTLGGGSSAPFVDGKLWLGGNYATQQNLDNGPIRTSAHFTFAPFAAGTDTVTMVRTITLDANTRFSKFVNYYASRSGQRRIPVGAGMVVHENARLSQGAGFVALTEPCSDSQQPVEDGDISLAVILPGGTPTQADGHTLLTADALLGEPLTFWAGSGWSKNGIESDAAWKALVEAEVAKIGSPLEVSYK